MSTDPNRSSLAVDPTAAGALRGALKKDKRAAIHQAAQEFEALFLEMVMKSMRATTSQDSLTDSDATRFFTSMFDAQLSKNLSKTGTVGLAQMLEKQLTRNLPPEEGVPADENDASGQAAQLSAFLARAREQMAQSRSEAAAAATLASANVAAFPGASAPASAANSAGSVSETLPETPRDFVEAVWPHAVEASRSTGIPPQFLVAHAALESGWGRHVMPNADGGNSHNLFGIKAGGSWSGATTDAQTTEYEGGVAVNKTESFRAYDSYAESFADYARLLADNPRYGAVIGSQNGTEFASRLQQAGYATDPKYAEKLAGIINGPTLRQALIG